MVRKYGPKDYGYNWYTCICEEMEIECEFDNNNAEENNSRFFSKLTVAYICDTDKNLGKKNQGTKSKKAEFIDFMKDKNSP